MKTLKKLGKDIYHFFKAFFILCTIIFVVVTPIVGYNGKILMLVGCICFIVAFIYAFIKDDYVLDSSTLEEETKLIPRKYKD